MDGVVVMDIETYEERHKVVPYLMVLKYGDISYPIYKEDNDIILLFLNKIVEMKEKEKNLKKIKVYTHNINFDGFILIEYFLSNNLCFEWFLRDLNLYSLSFFWKKMKIDIFCSFKLLGTSVKKLGLLLNKKKGVFPHRFVSKEFLNYKGKIPSVNFFESETDYFLFKESNPTDFDLKETAIKYAIIDVEIVYESLKNVLAISDQKIFKKSLSFSSYSYKLFCKNYDFIQITKKNINISERSYVEKAYFGGRTEIFGNTRDGLIHRFDFPGMYGSCMKELFPCGSPQFEIPRCFSKPGFYTATVYSNLEIPILPVRTKKGKILYPNGRFTTTLTKDEFEFFQEKGGQVNKIHSALTFPKEDYVFRQFVEDFEKIKSRGGFYKLYGKLVINGLYGSFALKKDKIRYYLLENEKSLDDLVLKNEVKKLLKFDNYFVVGLEQNQSLGLDEREDRNLSYAAFISAKARIKLHKNLYAVNTHYSEKYKDRYKLLYLETDSIDVALPKDCLGEKIMDVEWQKKYSSGVYVSPKFYSLKEDGKSRIKGVSSSSYSHEEILKFFYEDKEELLFNAQLQFSKKLFFLSQNYVDKVLKMSSYDKRIFSKNKLDTTALVLNN